MTIKEALESVAEELRRHKFTVYLGPARSSDDFVVVTVGTGAFRTTTARLQQPTMIINIARVLRRTGQRVAPNMLEITEFFDSNHARSIQAIFADVDNPPQLPPGVGVQPIEFTTEIDKTTISAIVRCRLTIVK